MTGIALFPSLRATLASIRANLWSIAAFAAAFYLLRSATFVPLQAWLLHNALEQSGQASIVNFDLIGFLLSPVGLIWLIVTMTIAFALLAAQQSGSLLGAVAARQGLRIGLTGKLLLVIPQLPRILSTCLIQSVAVFVLIAAYGGYLIFVGADLLSRHDINHFLTAWPPELVRLVILATLGAVPLIACLTMFAIIWTMALPILVTGSGWWATPLVAGWRASRGHRVRIAAVLVAWSLLSTIVLFLLGSALFFASRFTIGLLTETMFLLVAMAGTALVISHVIIGLTEMALISGYSFLAEELWFRVTGDSPDLSSKARAVSDAKPGSRSTRRLVLVAGAIAMAALSAGAAFALIETAEFRRDTLVIAHRGASHGAPENTLAAFRLAIDEGANIIELDVQQTADGEIVVIHDKDLKRVTGSDGNVWELSAEEIAGLDAGSSFSDSFAGEVIPTLAKAIDFVDGRADLMIELKINGHNPELTRDLLDLVDKTEETKRFSFISLDLNALEQIRQLDTSKKTGLLVSANIGDINRLDVDFLAVSKSLVDEHLLDDARAARRPVYVWTIDDEDEMFRMLDLGVDGIITNRPGFLRDLMDQLNGLTETERLVLLIGRRLRGN